MALRGSAIRRSYLLVAAAVVVAAGLTAGAAGGDRSTPGSVLDQRNPWRAAPCKYPAWAPDDPSGYAAQTFTAGVTGALTDVVLPVRGTTDQVTVAIAPVGANGAPLVGSPLASTSLAFTKPASYTSIDFPFPSRPGVVAGKQYAVVVSSATEAAPHSYIAWQADMGSSVGDESGTPCANGVYPGGRAWTQGSPPLGADADFFFETYVVPATGTQPAAPAKPGAATIRTLDVRSVPAAPTAGAAFTVLPSLTLSTGRKVAPTSVHCAAKLGGATLKGSGTGGCTFKIPRSATGKRLAVTVTAGYGGKTRTMVVVYKVRGPSAPPQPPPPPAPIAQAGHYAGTTTRGTPVSFDVTSDGRAITSITFGFSLPCSPSGTFDNPGFAFLPTTRFGLQADGTFAGLTNVTVNFSGATAGKLNFSFTGRMIGPGQAAGTLELRASVTQAGVAYECGPISDTWTATRG